MSDQAITKAPCLIVLSEESTERNDFELVCRRAGFSVDNVSSGFKLLSMLEKNQYDILVIGTGVDDMPIDEVLVLIRSSYTMSALPIVLFLNKYNDDVVAHYMELEVNDFLMRPINYNKALGIINYLIKSTSSS